MKPTSQQLFYNTIAKDFDQLVNPYDTQKRLEVIFNDLFPQKLTGKSFLDAGCGTGIFSAEADRRGAVVTALDIGPDLLKEVKKKCQAKTVVGSLLKLPFPAGTFKIVLSTEAIEHTPQPKLAISELARVLKPGGTLVLTTPNKLWHWSVTLANLLHLRPFQGLENWLSWAEVREALTKAGLIIDQEVGIHAFPFQWPLLQPILDRLHNWPPLRYYMINIALKCHKPLAN